MTTTSELELLSWPGKSNPAVLTDEGWAHVELPSGFDFGFDPPMERAAESGHRALVLRGERLACMRALAETRIAPLTLAYLDFPRLGHAPFARENLRVSTWLSALRSHAEAAARVLSPAGRVVVHVDDEGAALAMAALDEVFGSSSRESTILWQKKYSPQNDLRGRIDDAQDYLLVYVLGEPPASKLESEWWPWQYAGKSEDATREAEQLRGQGIITLQDIPKTSKPSKLVERLLDAYTSPGDLVLECFSDTGFASAAAATKNRVPILLSGDTDPERERLSSCSIPRLKHAVDVDNGVAEFVLHPPAYTAAKVAVSGEAIEIRTAPSVPRVRALRPILIESGQAAVVPSARGGFPSVAVRGPVPEVLVALEPAVGCDVTLALFDWTTPPPAADVELHLGAAARLLEKEGVVAVSVDHMGYDVVRLVGELKVFGRGHYLGTIAVEQAGLSPKLILLFKGLPEARLGKIGLPKERDYAASDADPRGPWRDPGHKGARSGSKNTAFEYRLPPYRWEIVEGDLPPGAWRLNPTSGVIWAGRLEAAGIFRFKVRVTDSSGRHSESRCSLEVSDSGRPTYPESVWWMDRAASTSEGAPRITSLQLPRGVVGEPYSAVVEADGGNPTNETTAPGEPTEGGLRTRYWEFARRTLVAAILEDRAYFGATGKAKPRIKKYLSNASSDQTMVELSWWDDQRLAAQSPEMRLVTMLSGPGDLVLIRGGEGPADVLRSGRRCILVGDESPGDRFPFLGRLGDAIAVWDPDRRAFRANYGSPDFERGLPWLLGFLPPFAVLEDGGVADIDDLRGVTADASESLTMLTEMEWPTRSRCEDLARQCGEHFSRVHVLYYRGKPPRGVTPLRFRRIPFDFAGAI